MKSCFRSVWAPLALTLTLTLTFGLAIAFPQQAVAQSYPSKPIRLIVPFPAGGGVDLMGRIIAPKLSEAMGQPVVVENRAGANGMIGAELVARAAPDGHTLLIIELGSLTISAGLYPNLPFDPVKDLAPVSMVSYSPHLVTVGEGNKLKTMQELIRFARANPGKLNYASAGTGSAPHLVAVLLGSEAKFQWTHVPYKGVGPGLADVAAGQVDAIMTSMFASLSLVKGGKLRALAVTGKTRSPLLPNVPTMLESGVDSFVTGSWQTVFAPGGTPPAIVSRLNTEVRRIMQDPAVAERLAALATEPAPASVEETRTLVREDIARWKKVIVETGVKAE
jgi:tripartite-type tricarboxylate transporter receptor subunit TctC